DQMRDMDTLRAELARRTLRYGPQTEFGAGKGGITDPATHSSGGASKEDITALAWQHEARRLTAGQEAGIARHLPHFIEQWEIDIGADIEDADVEPCSRVGVLEECRDLLLFARIQRAPDDPPVCGFDLGNQGRQFLTLSASGKTVNPSDANFLAIAAP